MHTSCHASWLESPVESSVRLDLGSARYGQSDIKKAVVVQVMTVRTRGGGSKGGVYSDRQRKHTHIRGDREKEREREKGSGHNCTKLNRGAKMVSSDHRFCTFRGLWLGMRQGSHFFYAGFGRAASVVSGRHTVNYKGDHA